MRGLGDYFICLPDFYLDHRRPEWERDERDGVVKARRLSCGELYVCVHVIHGKSIARVLTDLKRAAEPAPRGPRSIVAPPRSMLPRSMHE